MSIPTYQVFNVDKESSETCGKGKSGYLPRTNYILDSFRNRKITNEESIKDEGERQYDGSYNMEQRNQSQMENQNIPSGYTEPFYNFKSLSPTLIIISVSSLLIFLYVIYNILKGRKK